MSAPLVVVVDGAAEAAELRAFLAAHGAALGWVAWSCAWCPTEGEAPTRDDALRVLRVHAFSAHVLPGGNVCPVTTGGAETGGGTAE